jgi:hypothetical protein
MSNPICDASEVALVRHEIMEITKIMYYIIIAFDVEQDYVLSNNKSEFLKFVWIITFLKTANIHIHLVLEYEKVTLLFLLLNFY